MKFELLNKGKGRAEVLLYDEIGEGFFGSGISAIDFAEALNGAGDINDLTVRINSPGGDIFDGLTIYHTLARHSAAKHMVVEGLAGSIASVILQAGDRRSIAENAFVMIHEPYAHAVGTADKLRTVAGTLDGARENMLDIYASKAGAARRDEISGAIAAETWYTADEAVDAGLVDDIDVALQAAACVTDDMVARYKWQHVPRAAVQQQQQIGAKMRVAIGQQRQRLAGLPKR